MRMRGVSAGKVGPVRYAESNTAAIFKHHMKSLQKDGYFEKKNNRAYVVPSGAVFVGEGVVKGVSTIHHRAIAN